MEKRLTEQILYLIELDKAGHLTPEIQDDISDLLHQYGQAKAPGMFPGGAVGQPKSLLPPIPKPPSFPKLPSAPKIGVKMP